MPVDQPQENHFWKPVYKTTPKAGTSVCKLIGILS